MCEYIFEPVCPSAHILTLFPSKTPSQDVHRQHYVAARQGFPVYDALFIYLCCCQPSPVAICPFLRVTALSDKQGWPAPGDWTEQDPRPGICAFI